MNAPVTSSADAAPRGVRAFGAFLLIGGGIASLAGATLVLPGTTLDRVWDLNPRAYQELAPFGRSAGILFLTLGVTLFVAGFGWFRRRLWGWRLAVLIIAAQVAGDLINAFLGHFVEGGVGVVIAGALLFYLSRTKVRGLFGNQTALS